MNLIDVDEFNGCRLSTRLMFDYRLRLWAPTSALHAISVVAELLVFRLIVDVYYVSVIICIYCLVGRSIHVCIMFLRL